MVFAIKNLVLKEATSGIYKELGDKLRLCGESCSIISKDPAVNAGS